MKCIIARLQHQVPEILFCSHVLVIGVMVSCDDLKILAVAITMGLPPMIKWAANCFWSSVKPRAPKTQHFSSCESQPQAPVQNCLFVLLDCKTRTRAGVGRGRG